MQRTYKHLSAEERALIQLAINHQQSLRHIALQIGRSVATISRECARVEGSYDATVAAGDYPMQRKCGVKRRKIRDGTRLYAKVRDMLQYRQWSPEQIAQKLKLENPDDPSMHVRHETLYSTIYAQPCNELKKRMMSQLRRAQPRRGRRRNVNSTAAIKVDESQSIHARPEAIEQRQNPGHWKGDLIVGAANRSAVGTLVERKTGFVILCKVDSKSAQDVRTSFERQMKKIDAFMRLSMTYDRGSEMAQHALMSANLKMDICFADPHAPWQRGSSENTNGLLRQYLPKGEDLSGYSQTALNDIAWLLNTRPRKRFDWDSPQDRFLAEIEQFKSCST